MGAPWSGSGFAFTCYRQALIALNAMYLVVGLVLIIVPLYSKVSSVFTSWPIVGGTISCGVFIILIALAGLYGSCRHHQIILFFYMAVLVIIFIILFSVSVAALSISTVQEKILLENSWSKLSKTSRSEVQQLSDCCGFENMNITSGNYGHPSCKDLSCCMSKLYSCPSCGTCYYKLKTNGLKELKSAVGGVGLFFSFTLFLGVYTAFKYRHLKDPRANPSAFL